MGDNKNIVLQYELDELRREWEADGGREGCAYVDLMKTRIGRHLAELSLLQHHMNNRDRDRKKYIIKPHVAEHMPQHMRDYIRGGGVFVYYMHETTTGFLCSPDDMFCIRVSDVWMHDGTERVEECP